MGRAQLALRKYRAVLSTVRETADDPANVTAKSVIRAEALFEVGLDPNIRQGYQGIEVNFKVKSDADREKILELVKKSPVYDIISNPVPIKVNVVTQ